MSIGIPIKLLHEAEGHIVTLETTTGDVYRGKLLEAEDNMNCQMQNITVTGRDGRVTQVEQVFVRGSMIRFLILPDMLKNAPMFKPKAAGSRGVSAGGGKSAMLRAQGKGYYLQWNIVKAEREREKERVCVVAVDVSRDEVGGIFDS